MRRTGNGGRGLSARGFPSTRLGACAPPARMPGRSPPTVTRAGGLAGLCPGRADPCCCSLSGDAESVVAWIRALLRAGWRGSRRPVPRNPVISSRGRPVAASLRSESRSVQFSRSVVPNSATLWTAACQASLSITDSWSLLKLHLHQPILHTETAL